MFASQLTKNLSVNIRRISNSYNHSTAIPLIQNMPPLLIDKEIILSEIHLLPAR